MSYVDISDIIQVSNGKMTRSKWGIDSMILKVRLKEILEELNMTQKELAELTGLRPNTISELVKNTRDSINRKHLGTIAEALKIKDTNKLLHFE